jgi:hypothetical protein
MKRTVAFATVLAAAAAHSASAFLPVSRNPPVRKELRLSSINPAPVHPSTSLQLSSNEDNSGATSSLSKSETILHEFHQSEFTFRIVVIGNGAILETTSKLGPKTATTISPKTGDKLMTFASLDASFEFHVKVDQVCMITFVSTEKPDGKVMRVSRFLNEKGTPICSLILADSSEKAIDWFEGMVEKYGQEAIM